MRNAASREGRDHATLLPCAAAVAGVVALAALAAEWPARQPAAQSAPCTTIADDAERLACYDRALRASSPEPVAPAPAAQAPATAPASEAAASAKPRDADKETIAIVVVRVRTLAGRETAFTAQDGVTWVQTDSQRVVGLPDTPFDAELKPGAMGSKFLVPKNGARGIRVRSVER
jgi:hypothetical protein